MSTIPYCMEPGYTPKCTPLVVVDVFVASVSSIPCGAWMNSSMDSSVVVDVFVPSVSSIPREA
jgi:hypothetical protein